IVPAPVRVGEDEPPPSWVLVPDPFSQADGEYILVPEQGVAQEVAPDPAPEPAPEDLPAPALE
ncbi:hypothetical protein ACJX0J_020490, partial [Zea mays]